MSSSYLRPCPRRVRARRSFTLIDLVATLIIVMLLTLLASATMLSVLNNSRNDGAEATALAAAGDAVGLAANQGQITTDGAITTAAAETPGVSILTPPGIVDANGYTTVIYHVTPSYGGTANVTVSFPDVIGGTPILGGPPGSTGPTVPGTPSTPLPRVTVNNYSVSGDTMTWSWDPSTGGTGPYTYYWSVSPTAGATCSSGSTNVTSVTCSGVLQPVTEYTFSVFAQDSVGAASSVGTVSQVSAGPGATSTTAAPGGSTTTLAQNVSTPNPYVSQNTYGVPNGTMSWSWSPSTGGEGALTYYWSISPTTSGCSFGSTTTTTVTCSSVTPGTTYTFSVYAADANGDTSGVASVTAVAASASATTTTSASSTTGVGSLSTPVLSIGANTYGTPYDTLNWDWTASTGGSGTISYFWSVSPTTSGCSSGETNTQSFTCTSALAGTSYTFSVYAQDPAGATSGIATITVTAAGNGTAPTNNTVSTPSPFVSSNTYTSPDSSVSFAWGPSSGGTGGYTYYWSIQTQGGSVVSSGATNSTSATDPSLIPGTYYIFNVYAVDNTGDTSGTGSVAVVAATLNDGGCSGGCGTPTTSPIDLGGNGLLTAPQPTVTVNSTPSGSTTGEMAWSWTPVTGGSGGYTYYYTLSPGACAGAATTATSASCSNMTPGVTYTFSVYATDSTGTNSNTGSVAATQQLAGNSGGNSGTPGVTAWGRAGQTFATVGWTENDPGITSARLWVGLSDNCTAGIGELDLTYSNNPTSDTQQVGLSEALVAGQTYSAFAVVNGVRSSPSCVTFTPEVLAPPTPVTTAFSPNSGGATVSWSDSTGTGITTVDVETYSGAGCSSGAHSAAGSYAATNNTTSGTISVVGDYTAGTTYSAKVTAAYNAGGVSGPGNCISYTVPGGGTTTTTSGGGGGIGPVPEVRLTDNGIGSGGDLNLSWSYATPNGSQSYGVSRVILLCYPAYTYDNGTGHVAAGCESVPTSGTTALSTDQTSGTPQINLTTYALFGGWVIAAEGKPGSGFALVNNSSGPGTAQIVIYNAAGRGTYSDPPANYSPNTGPTPIPVEGGVYSPGICVFGYCI